MEHGRELAVVVVRHFVRVRSIPITRATHRRSRGHRVRRIHVEEAVRRVVPLDDRNRRAVLDDYALQSIGERGAGVVIAAPIAESAAGATRVRRGTKPGPLPPARARAVRHEAAHDGPTRTLDGIRRRLVRALELLARPRRQPEYSVELRRLIAIAVDAEHIHHVAIEIVVDLEVRARFAHEDRRGAGVRLDVHAVGGEVLDDPRRNAPLRAVVAEDGSRRSYGIAVTRRAPPAIPIAVCLRSGACPIDGAIADPMSVL